MSSNKDFEKFLARIQKKLDKNPELKDEIEDKVGRLSEIFETDIEISFNFSSDVEDYKEIYKKYDLDEDSSDLEGEEELIDNINETMKLKDFISMLNDEDGESELSFDPIYLKKGINNINNMLITTIGNQIIIVPTIPKK